ncbi:MAG TPA: flagellar basal body rod protein FlgC [Burkholderiaceae bacterium]
MDYSRAFAISAAGMTLERTRVEVAAMNLANANTVQGVDGVSYQPLRVVASAAPLSSAQDFSQALGREADGLGAVGAGFAVPQAVVEPNGQAPRRVYEPGNPYADAKGYVAYAGVDNAAEMVTMMSAMRSYEANIAAMNMSKTLAVKALQIGETGS